MTTSHFLYENTPTTAWTYSATLNNGESWGPEFTASFGYCVALGWYKPTSGHSPPSALHLWDTTTSSAVVSVTSGIPNGAVGWQSVSLSSPFQLVSGRAYRVSGYWGPSTVPPQGDTSNRVAAPSPLTFSDYGRHYTENGGDVYPATAQTAYMVPVDLGWNDDGSEWAGFGGGGGGGGTTNADLASWLSSQSGVNAHQDDGLPWKSYQQLTDGDTGLGAIAGLLGDALGAGWASATDTLHQIGTKVGSILTAVTTGPLPGITGLEDLANTIIDKLDAAATFLQNPTAGWPGAASGRQVFPATGWTMVDEVDFTFQKSWDVPADLYVLTVSTFPVDIVDVDVDGAHWRPRLGWWAQRNGDGFGARSFVDWETSYLQDGGRRMNGVVIRTQPACDCHVQAWVLA